MNPKLPARILRAYGLDFTVIHEPQKGYRNQSYAVQLTGGETINVIIYKHEPGILRRIQDAHQIGEYLAECGFPVRHPYDARIIKLAFSSYEKFAGLYNYLPGDAIPWEAYTRRHIKLLGKTMAEMHTALTTALKPQTNVIAEYRAILERMERYFQNAQVKTTLRQKLGCELTVSFDYFKKLLKFCETQPAQPLHMDFVRGNILFQGEGETLTISGILDFEKTANGARVFDIARTLAFLLVDCKYVDESKVWKYFLYSGYKKRGRGQVDSLPLLKNLVDLFLLYDFYKFLRHNPYEFLEQNEHFIRTKGQLQKRQRLSVHKA